VINDILKTYDRTNNIDKIMFNTEPSFDTFIAKCKKIKFGRDDNQKKSLVKYLKKS